MSAPLREDVAKLLGILSSFPGQKPPINSSNTQPIQPPQPLQPLQQQSYYPNAISLASLLQLQNDQPQTQSQPKDQAQFVQQPFNISNPQIDSTPSLDSQVNALPPPPKPKPVVVDPSTITTFPRALNYITKTLNTPSFISKIRQMKQSQHNLERQWFSERQTLIDRQSSRKNSSAQLSSLLSSIPGCGLSAQSIQVHTPSEEENKKELLEYDLRIHKKTVDMVRMMEGELAGLGVPFFCAGKGGKTKKDGGEMEPEDLAKLRMRVLELLEDLAAEEEE